MEVTTENASRPAGKAGCRTRAKRKREPAHRRRRFPRRPSERGSGRTPDRRDAQSGRGPHPEPRPARLRPRRAGPVGAGRAGLEPGLEAHQRGRRHGQLDHAVGRGAGDDHMVGIERHLLGALGLPAADEGQRRAREPQLGTRREREVAKPIQGLTGVPAESEKPTASGPSGPDAAAELEMSPRGGTANGAGRSVRDRRRGRGQAGHRPRRAATAIPASTTSVRPHTRRGDHPSGRSAGNDGGSIRTPSRPPGPVPRPA